MKVLIGESSVHEDKDKDKKAAGNKKDAAGNSDQATAAVQNDSKKIPDKQVSFLNDHRMLGLTGYHQKKMQEMMQNMEDDVAGDKVGQINANTKAAHKSSKSSKSGI